MERRLPRCPALKSPVLSPKTPALYDKNKSGCAWGLIHFFDFRQGHLHGKLISDKKLPNRQAKGDGYTKNRPNFLSNDALDKQNLAVNSRKTEVKKVTEGGMSVKHHTKDTSINAGMQNLPFNPKLVGPSKDYRKTCMTSSKKKSCPFLACGCDAAAEAYRQPSANKNKLVSAIEASGDDVHINNGPDRCCKSIRGRKQDHHAEINRRVHMNEAVEAFVNQKLTDGENHPSGNEVANQSKNLIDALEVLNSNRELFMKLLQDPNSLLAKHIQNLRDSQAKKQPPSSSKAKTSHCEAEEKGEYEGPANSPKPESCNGFLSKGSDMPQPLSTIVVLKAGIQNCPDRISNWPSPQSQFSLMKKERSSIRPAFLSFEHMKRKLRHAMRVNRKEHGQMVLDASHNSPHDFEKFEDWRKDITKQANERIYANSSYSDVGKMSESSHEVNRKDGTGQAERFGSGIGSKAASSTEGCHRTSNLLSVGHLKGKLHSRKHLSDMLVGGNEDFSRKLTLSTLDRLMSSPEYDLFPTLNPGRQKEHAFASQMRFSPYSNLSTVYNGYEWRVQKEKKSSCLSSSLSKNLGAQPVFNNEKPDDRLQSSKNGISVHGEDLIQKVNQTSACPRKVMEGSHAVSDEHESNALEVSLEPNSVQNTNTNQRTEAFNIFGESEYFESLKLDSPLGDQTSSSIDVYSISSPSRAQRAEDSDSMIDDRVEQPSPISVLEQFFVEDNISSPSTVSLVAEPPVEPFCIDIEELYASSPVKSHLDLKISNAGASMDKQGSLSEGIRAVLQISGLNWEELSRKWHLLDQTLDSSLFDDINVEVWPEKSSTDRRLLFGYINEVLSEIHQCYSRCSPWVSLLNRRPQLDLLSKNMVHDEVLKHVDWSLLSEIPQQTLQQLVEKDLAKSGTVWMDIRLDTEEVVTELVDIIIEDLVVDAAIRLQT